MNVRAFRYLALAVALGLPIGGTAGDPPPLPTGLGGGSAPPSLPSGLGGTASESVEPEAAVERWRPFGFVEARAGVRLNNAPGYSDATLGEVRLQLQVQEEIGPALFSGTVDLLYDDRASGRGFDWERGDGWMDPRELNVSLPLASAVDAKIGRQVATWGVGDLLFINDLFPKDWNSFFLGRDLEYLKAPQDSLRVSAYHDLINLDLVYSPRFEPDRYMDGSRLVYWNAQQGALNVDAQPFSVASPGDAFEADELHLRLSRMVGRFELAAYGYWGYWKSPAGRDPVVNRSIFPELEVFGASARGPVGDGLLSVEFGAYDSQEDPSGRDPMIRNGELRLLLGYEQELAKELTGAVQFYQERARYFAAASDLADRDRELVTLRLSKLLRQQTLTVSGFLFYSPSQEDRYLRLSASWKSSDDWRWEAGANLFGGERSSFFGQFGRNENLYFAVRRLY